MNTKSQHWFRVAYVLCLTMPLVGQGCTESTIACKERKKIDDKVSGADWNAFLRIVRTLPDGRLPEFSQVFEDVPEWNWSRNLPVNELVQEHQDLLNRRWSVEQMAQNLRTDRTLQRAMRREQMTVEQFVSLALTLGTALSRSTLRKDQDLGAIVREGEVALRRMRADSRRFSSLTNAGKYDVSHQARGMTRVDRASHLKLVPPENIEFARKHRETLAQVLPSQFASNPLDSLADRAEERGVPFDELAGLETDDHPKWDSGDAVIGKHVPDSTLATESTRRPSSASVWAEDLERRQDPGT